MGSAVLGSGARCVSLRVPRTMIVLVWERVAPCSRFIRPLRWGMSTQRTLRIMSMSPATPCCSSTSGFAGGEGADPPVLLIVVAPGRDRDLDERGHFEAERGGIEIHLVSAHDPGESPVCGCAPAPTGRRARRCARSRRSPCGHSPARGAGSYGQSRRGPGPYAVRSSRSFAVRGSEFGVRCPQRGRFLRTPNSELPSMVSYRHTDRAQRRPLFARRR